jgi:hypothetical protein
MTAQFERCTLHVDAGGTGGRLRVSGFAVDKYVVRVLLLNKTKSSVHRRCCALLWALLVRGFNHCYLLSSEDVLRFGLGVKQFYQYWRTSQSDMRRSVQFRHHQNGSFINTAGLQQNHVVYIAACLGSSRAVAKPCAPNHSEDQNKCSSIICPSEEEYQ